MRENQSGTAVKGQHQGWIWKAVKYGLDRRRSRKRCKHRSRNTM